MERVCEENESLRVIRKSILYESTRGLFDIFFHIRLLFYFVEIIKYFFFVLD